MALKPLPPRELLHQLLRYDAETGDLVWLPQPRERFAAKKHHLCWNTQHAGKIAGYVRPSKSSRDYLHIGIRGYSILKAHRLVWLYVYGEPVPEKIDHKDNDCLNNRVENLRASTHSQNRANSKVRKDNVLGVKGVIPTRDGMFMGRIARNGKVFHLGTFNTIDEAADAYKEAASRLYGEFARWDER